MIPKPLVTIPILEFADNGDIHVKIQKRPCLILDDGRGLIVEEDYRNYHALKLTTQYDSYKRMLIKVWKQIGLVRKSYVRIEIPFNLLWNIDNISETLEATFFFKSP